MADSPISPSPADPALDAFSAWASRFFLSRSAARAAVTGTSEQTAALHRVRWTVAHRVVVAKQQETTSRARKLDDPLDPASFDPWAEDAASLPERTRQLTVCETCSGDKRVECAICGGDGQVRCDNCSGSGRVYSTRSHKQVSCRSCGGDGLKACACRSGSRKCPVCAGKGRAERWLVVEERRSASVWYAGDDRLAALFDGVGVPTSFETHPGAYPFAPTSTFQGARPEEAPPAWEPVLQRAAKAAPKLARHDRLVEVRAQGFEVPVVHLEYTLGGARGEADVVMGRDATLHKSPTSRKPFHTRLFWLVVASVGALGWGGALFLWYVGRHTWYATQPAALLLPLLGGLAALTALPLVAHLCLPRRAWHPARLAVPAGALALVLSGQLATAASGAPSAGAAELKAASGDRATALVEAAAAADLGIEVEAAGSLHDRLALEALDGIADAHQTWDASAGRFFTDDARQRARETAVARLKADVASRLQAERPEQVEADLARLLEAAPEDPELPALQARLHLVTALGCVEPRDGACVGREVAAARQLGSADADVDVVYQRIDAAVGATVGQLWTTIRKDKAAQARVDACKTIEPQLVFLSAAGVPEGRYPTVAKATDPCERAVDMLVAEQERARKKEEAAARAWAYRPVRCRDGTRSPSCVCGGSYRGCCSHHGGVAGCD